MTTFCYVVLQFLIFGLEVSEKTQSASISDFWACKSSLITTAQKTTLPSASKPLLANLV